MTDPRKTEDRDSVLFAFHQECDRPTAEQIIAWANDTPTLRRISAPMLRWPGIGRCVAACPRNN